MLCRSYLLLLAALGQVALVQGHQRIQRYNQGQGMVDTVGTVVGMADNYHEGNPLVSVDCYCKAGNHVQVGVVGHSHRSQGFGVLDSDRPILDPVTGMVVGKLSSRIQLITMVDLWSVVNLQTLYTYQQ